MKITIATPGGKPATVDQVSLSAQANHGDVAKAEALSAYLDEHANALKAPLRIEDINVSDQLKHTKTKLGEQHRRLFPGDDRAAK